MNRDRDDHNILGMTKSNIRSPRVRDLSSSRAGEGGYTLVSLLALMTLMTLFAMAAAPSIVQQEQREREKEAIFRGEEVADAIRIYYKSRGISGDAGLPTSMDQLLEGVQRPNRTKKLQVLRPSAARDPLSPSGEWQLVAPRTQRLINFETALLTYTGGILPTPQDPQIAALQRNTAPALGGIISSGTLLSGSSDTDDTTTTGPFVGVRSSSKHSAVITYYGIDTHNQWIFTPLFR